jgi:hypothetical protein
VKVPDLIEKRIVKQFPQSIGTGRRNDYVCAQPRKRHGSGDVIKEET